SSDHVAVLMDGIGRCRAGGIPARAQFRLCSRRQSAWHLYACHHVSACAAQCDGGYIDLDAVYPDGGDHHLDQSRLSGFWDAAGLGIFRRIAVAGKKQPASPLAGPDGVLFAGDFADVADLYRGGGARCVRSAQGDLMLLDVQNLSVDFKVAGKPFHAVNNASFSIEAGETVALVGESGSGKSVTALSLLKLLPYPMASHPSGKILWQGSD